MFGMLEFLALVENENEGRLFERLYKSYRELMRAVARSVLLSDADAEDAVHETFLKLAKRHMPTVSRIEDEQDVKNYLLKVTKNTALNMKRAGKRTDYSEEPRAAARLAKRSAPDDRSFLESVCRDMEYERVKRAVERLDPVYRDVMYYHFVMDMTIPQTARALERKEATVKKQLVRGKKLLLESLAESGEDRDGDN